MQLKHDPSSNIARPRAKETEARVPSPADYDDGLLRVATPIMICSYSILLGIAAYTFWQSGETMIAVAICLAYMVMFFGVPVLMTRIRHHDDSRWSRSPSASFSEKVSIFSGSIGRTDALLQMVIVPLAVTIAFGVFAAIWLSVRP